MSRKIVSIALTATTLVFGLGLAVLPVAANAQTTTDLQAQIAALLAQINQLQGQLGSQGTATTSMAAYTFTKDLTLGSSGADVTALQQMLISKGYLTAVSAPTGYFGSLTEAAVAKFQAANGISPAAGYFGPKTRAFVNSMSVSTGTTTTTTTTTTLPAGCTSTAGFSPTTGASCATGTTTTGTTVIAPATGLAVSLASDNPPTGSLISSNGAGTSGAARVPVLSVNFTAGTAGAVTLSNVSFQKIGVLSDSSVSGAYLTQNGQVVAQYSSLNSGTLTFSGMNLQIPAGQTVELTLAIDVAGNLSAGNTTGFSIPAASNVTAFDTMNNAVTPTGLFPLNGNTFTVTNVSNPSLATVAIASSSIGNTVTAGTQGNLVGAWNFTVNNSKVYLKGINFHVIGSANDANLQNVKLIVNGTQVGATLPYVGANGTAYFNAMANPGVLNTGSNNVQVFADVMGSPSMNFQFEVLNGYDVLAVDSQYNVPVTISNIGGSAATELVNIQQGQITTTQDASTPTGNIAKGQSQITLGKFDIYAAGEPVKVQYLGFQLAFTGVATSSPNDLLVSNMVKNISVTDDAGGQVGTTINTPPTGNTCDAGTTTGLTGGTITNATVNYVDCFGTSGSPINYIVPANTTRVLSLKADVQNTANFATVTASLLAEGSNLQGLISSKNSGSSGATGGTLSLANSSLTSAQNNGLGAQTVSAGVTGLKIGSYSLGASSAEGVSVSNVSIQANGLTNGAGSPFQNLHVMINGTQFGTTQGVIGSGTIYTFSGSPFTIPAGSTVNLDVYADTLSSASGTVSPATILTGLSGTGLISNSAIGLTSPSSVNGQNLTFAGSATMTVGIDAGTPPAGVVTMGSTGNSLSVFRFGETSNVENVKVTAMTVTDSVTGPTNSVPKAAFSNLQLWNGSTLLGTANAASTTVTSSTAGTASYNYTFNIQGTPVQVPQGGSVSITLKGDAGSYSGGGATDNSAHTFSVGSSTITALGATANTVAITVTGSATGNAQTVVRSTATVSGSSMTQNGGKLPLSQIGSITVTANNAGAIQPGKITVTFSGNGWTLGSSTFLPSVQLRDAAGNNVTSTADAATVTSTIANGTITWTFPTSTAIAVGQGSSVAFQLWGSTNLIPASGNVSESLAATIQGTGDFQYYDGTDANAYLTGLISLPNSAVPITVSALSWGSGQ